MTIKRMFTREQLLSFLQEDEEDGTAVVNQLVESTRWSLIYKFIFKFIFKFEGKYYETSYLRGATEYQDEQPWQNKKEVECTEVEPYTRMVIDYRPKE